MLRAFLAGSCLSLALALSSPAPAAEAVPDAPKPAAAAETDKVKPPSDEPKERLVPTTHSLTMHGERIDYTAVAGTIFLRDREEKPTAEIFFIAYTRSGIDNPAARPITFSFNGGPGSSSVWLHLGLLGPQRVLLQDDGRALPPPYQLVDNEHSLLDETDLVFIDPVSTGFSRALKPDDAKKFHGVHEDITSVAEFIRLYVTRHGRWSSPKFLIGESYGTTRAAGLSSELSEHHRMNLNGIMLVSTVLNFATISFGHGNDLPYPLFLPSYTATAWFHQKLPPDLQAQPLTRVIAAAETFAARDYSAALFRGAELPAAERLTIIRQLARFTGLSEAFLDRADLRVTMGQFGKELLRDRDLVIGRFDSRFTGYVRDRLALNTPYDPSAEAVMSAFASTFNHYVRADLGFEMDRPYAVLSRDIESWNWSQENGFVNVTDSLSESLTRNPFLRIHVSSGYYDLATPYFATRYTFDHLMVNPALMGNITFDDYTAGHMMYLNLADLKKQKADLARFIRAASAPAR